MLQTSLLYFLSLSLSGKNDKSLQRLSYFLDIQHLLHENIAYHCFYHNFL